MRIAICEDDLNMQQCLSDAIEDWSRYKRVKVDILCYQSAERFHMVWPELAYDLIFLDIHMQGMTGIELAERIRETDKNMMIVFVTSFSQYAIKGYDVDALHYLIKPLSASKLIPILDKAHTIWHSRQYATILVLTETGQTKLQLDSIYCISMLSHKANIQTESDTYGQRKTAEELSAMLPEYFIRCHRSFIVNLNKVDCVYKESLLLSNGKSLPVSRNNSKAVRDAFIRLNSGNYTL